MVFQFRRNDDLIARDFNPGARSTKVEVNSQYNVVFQFRRNDDLIARDFNPGARSTKVEVNIQYSVVFQFRRNDEFCSAGRKPWVLGGTNRKK